MPILSLMPGVGSFNDFDDISVNSSAVAGPVPIAPCSLSPVMMCSDNPGSPDVNCSDGSCFGYNINSLYCMTQGASNNPTNDFCDSSSNPTLGAGNVGFLDFGALSNSNSGASTLKSCLADSPGCNDVCLADTTNIPTKTGNNWGPVREGIESLFNLENPDSGWASDKLVGGTNSADTVITIADLVALGYGTAEADGGSGKVPGSGLLPADLLPHPNPHTEYNTLMNLPLPVYKRQALDTDTPINNVSQTLCLRNIIMSIN